MLAARRARKCRGTSGEGLEDETHALITPPTPFEEEMRRFQSSDPPCTLRTWCLHFNGSLRILLNAATDIPKCHLDHHFLKKPACHLHGDENMQVKDDTCRCHRRINGTTYYWHVNNRAGVASLRVLREFHPLNVLSRIVTTYYWHVAGRGCELEGP